MSSAVPVARGVLPADPIARFVEVFEQAKRLPRECVPEPTAFALATVDERGSPSVRIVLLKHVDRQGFVFYTNFQSRKGRELQASGRAAMCFHWQPLDVQVRVEGRAEPVTDAEADAYFATRSRGSQLGAWASSQSEEMASPGDLTERVAEMERRFSGQDVPRPPHWSGFRIIPERIEFWKNMPSRLHVRHLYTRTHGGWEIRQLYP